MATFPEHLVVPEGWTLTPQGMSCLGAHALDLWAGLNDDGVACVAAPPAVRKAVAARRNGSPVGELVYPPLVLHALIPLSKMGLVPAPPFSDDYSAPRASERLLASMAEGGLDLEDALGPEQTRLLGLVLDELAPPRSPEAEFTEALSRYLEEEERRGVLSIVDLGEIMQAGVSRPVMQEENLLARGKRHTAFGDPGSWKSWLMLNAAARAMLRGETVVWIDKEQGAEEMARRFVVLGVPPDVVSAQLVYHHYPVLDGSKKSVNAWGAMLMERQPSLVVVDAQTGVLGDAGLKENASSDIARWASWYLDPCQRRNVTSVVIDHTGHDEKNRPRGGMQKLAGVSIALAVSSIADHDDTARVTVTCVKNNVFAEIPKVQRFIAGGDPFMFEPDDSLPPDDDRKAAARWDLDREIERVLREHSEREGADATLSQNQVVGMVEGKAATVKAALKNLASSELSGVQVRGGPNRTLLYSWVSPAVSPGGLVPSPLPGGTNQSGTAQ